MKNRKRTVSSRHRNIEENRNPETLVTKSFRISPSTSIKLSSVCEWLGMNISQYIVNCLEQRLKKDLQKLKQKQP